MKNKLINSALVLFSVVFTLFMLEIGVRVYKNEFRFEQFLEERRDLLQSAYPVAFDAELGWIPKEGDHPENLWKAEVTILEDGIRSNGVSPTLSLQNDDLILAIGDSFTFGDEVSNDESWPALLEKMSGRRVINGGVFGYGIDQSYLRMKVLAPKYNPSLIIFSFIPADIERNELSERGAPKPFFELAETGELVLNNDHVIHSPTASLDRARKILGYSFFADTTLSIIVPEYWLQGSWRRISVHSDGEAVTCTIFRNLEQFSKRTKIDIVILVQYPEIWGEKDISAVDNVSRCVNNNTLRLVDMRDSLDELKRQDSEVYDGLFLYGHMSKDGNLYVASLLHELISQ